MATFETNACKQLKSTLKLSTSQTTLKSQQASSSLCNQQENVSNTSCLKSLDVKTKSIESTLLPLVNQVYSFLSFCLCFLSIFNAHVMSQALFFFYFTLKTYFT